MHYIEFHYDKHRETESYNNDMKDKDTQIHCDKHSAGDLHCNTHEGSFTHCHTFMHHNHHHHHHHRHHQVHNNLLRQL